MIYLSPEIIGCRIMLTLQKNRIVIDDGTSSLQWEDIDPPRDVGTVIGYAKKDQEGDGGSYCLICIENDGSINHHYIGYTEEEYQISVHSDDFPYFIKKIQDRLRRGVSLAKDEEIDRLQLLDLEK